MLGFLKNLFKKPEVPEALVPPEPSIQLPASTATPAPAPAVLPAPAPSKPAYVPSKAAPVPAPRTAPAAPVEVISLPYKTLLATLPPSVQEQFTGSKSSAVLQLPLSVVLPQLARGKVQITLEDLRRFSTPGSISGNDGNQNLIDLPLAEILPRLPASQLARRTGQKTLQVDPDIPSAFGMEEGGFSASLGSRGKTPPKSTTPPPASSPRVETAVRETVAESSAASIPVPAPPAIAPSPVPATPPIRMPVAAAPVPSAPIPARVEQAGSVAVPMMMFVSHWASIGKSELSGLHRATAYIPVEQLEQALKKGKAVFSWGELRQWLQASSLPSLPDSAEIDLPLNIIAPIFLQARKSQQPQRRVEVDKSLPDLFGATRPATGSSAVPSTETPAATSAPVSVPNPTLNPAPAPAASAPIAPPAPPIPQPRPQPAAAAPAAPAAVPSSLSRPVLEYGEIFGQPQKKDWTLAEITQKTAALRGVSGALLATGDGLLIAGQWPGEVKSESVAAFVPQIFQKTLQYTRELGLREPEQFTLLLDNLPLQIFKTGANYLAVLGRSGETLPKAQLTALAIRLQKS